MPLVFIAIRPHEDDVQAYVPEPELPSQPVPQSNSPARRMDRSPFFNLFLLAAGIAVVVLLYVQGTFSFDVNMIILLFLIAGMHCMGHQLRMVMR